MKKSVEKTTYIVGLAAVAAIVGVIIYIFTSVTGYLASSALNILPIVSTVIAIVLMIAVMFANQKLPQAVTDIAMFVAVALLLYSFYEFVLGRVSLAADVYFIPVNYPASEATALHISIVGIALYVVADIAMIAAAFVRRSAEKQN